MRIVAGKYRSRRLKKPNKLPLRPTSDQLRETLFNILGPTVVGSLFVDVYAGTGAVGIEALSRGADAAVFIESRPDAAELIGENLRSLGIASGVEVLLSSAVDGLRKLAARGACADLIFLDPPYDAAEEYEFVLEFLDASPLLAPRGWVIVEHDRKRDLPLRLDRLERVRVVQQGDAALSFYRPALAA